MNYTIILLIFIAFLGTCLRLIGIIKGGGLWNDEYISWYISSIPLNENFWDAVKSQCHMPFYYLYLKTVTHLFGNNDIILRLSSVFTGVLSIFIMYFVGKEKSTKVGLLAAIFTAVSGFLIYFSQEVRLYGVLFLFSALSLLFTIKLLKNVTLANIVGYILSSILILFTHTIGFVYVFFSLLYVSIELFKTHKKIISGIWFAITGLFLSFLPLILKIFTTNSYSQWWKTFRLTDILTVFTDYFSPIISNAIILIKMNNYQLFIVTLSTLIALFFILFKAKENKGFLAVVFSTFLTIIIAASLDKMVLEPKYCLEIYPILIFLFCKNSFELKNRAIRNFLLGLFIFIQLFYVVSPNFAAKLPRNEGHKIVAQLVKNANLKKDDWLILTYYPLNRFEKYADFNDYNVISIHKGNFYDYYKPVLTYEETMIKGKKEYFTTFTKETAYYNEYLHKNVFGKMKKGQKVTFIFLNSVSFYDPMIMNQITSNNELYTKLPMLFLIFSDIKNKTIYDIQKTFTNIRYEYGGSWQAITITK